MYFYPFEPSPYRLPTQIITLEGERYHRAKIDNIPAGYATAPFLLEFSTSPLIVCAVTAGVGLSFSRSALAAASNVSQEGNAGFDTITPKNLWWVYQLNTLRKALKDEDETFGKVFRKEHGHASNGNFIENFWARVQLSTVWEIISVVETDDDGRN